MTLTLTVNDVLKSKIDIKLHYTTAHFDFIVGHSTVKSMKYNMQTNF